MGHKYDGILELKKLGLNVGEIKEFSYKEKDNLLKYAKFLDDTKGGFSVRTDFPPGDKRMGINLPILKDPTLDSLSKFVEEHKDKLTYLIYQKRDYNKVLWQGKLWLDDMKVLHGEVNFKDKGMNIRKALEKTENLELIKCGMGDYDERFIQVRSDLFKAKVGSNACVTASAYDEDGKVVIYYKELRRKLI